MLRFRFALCRFYLIPLQYASLTMAEHPGAMLRDRFGSALRHSVCLAPGRVCPGACELPEQCLYSRLFETNQNNTPVGDWQGRDLYRPFVLEPPSGVKRRYEPGEPMAFHLLLIGDAMDALPCFVAAFEEMGRHGFGASRTRWRLERVVGIEHSRAQDGELIFDGVSKVFSDTLPTKTYADIVAESKKLPQDRVTLELRTPLRLEERGALVRDVTVESLSRALLRRVSRLAQFWCGETLEMDYGAVIARWSEQITCEPANIRVETWRRDSMRQKRSHPLAGLRGDLNLRGNLDDMRLFLKLGEYLHIGRQTAFGLGQYLCHGQPE